jgi:hypothetical protein
VGRDGFSLFDTFFDIENGDAGLGMIGEMLPRGSF